MGGIGHSNVRDCLGFLCRKTEGNLQHLGQDRRVQGRDLDPRTPEYDLDPRTPEYDAGNLPLDGDVGWQGI